MLECEMRNQPAWVVGCFLLCAVVLLSIGTLDTFRNALEEGSRVWAFFTLATNIWVTSATIKWALDGSKPWKNTWW